MLMHACIQAYAFLHVYEHVCAHDCVMSLLTYVLVQAYVCELFAGQAVMPGCQPEGSEFPNL